LLNFFCQNNLPVDPFACISFHFRTMKTVAISSMFAVAAASGPSKMQMFADFLEKFGKKYSETEKAERFKIFSENMDKIHASNAQNKTYTLGITAHADRTVEEFGAHYATGFKEEVKFLGADKTTSVFTAPMDFEVPESVDWVARGGVTSVKNQGSCGSCWAFSAAGALEGAMFVAGHELQSLSEQQIIACDKGGNGCNGGSMDQAFDFAAKSGIVSLRDDPYICTDGKSSECQNMQCTISSQSRTGDTCTLHGQAFCEQRVPGSVCDKSTWIHHCVCPPGQIFEQGQCRATSQPDFALAPGDVIGHTDVEPTQQALEAAVAQQPVAVAIEADQFVFQHYTGGVLTNDACGSQLDHGVLVVGYGSLDGQKYWRVKNSWGSVWGDNGYINIERGHNGDGGECGIRKRAAFPTVRKESSVVV